MEHYIITGKITIPAIQEKIVINDQDKYILKFFIVSDNRFKTIIQIRNIAASQAYIDVFAKGNEVMVTGIPRYNLYKEKVTEVVYMKTAEILHFTQSNGSNAKIESQELSNQDFTEEVHEHIYSTSPE